MSQIISYLLVYNQYLINQIYQLTLFIAKYIPLKQWTFDDSKSPPSYQKLKIDKLPIIKKFFKQDYRFLLEYYLWKYDRPVKPVQRRNGKTIPEKLYALYVVLLINTFTTITVVKVNSNAKSAVKLLLQVNKQPLL